MTVSKSSVALRFIAISSEPQPCHFGQLSTQWLKTLIERPPHIEAWGFIDKIMVLLHGLGYHAGRWRHTAAIQVYNIGRAVKCLLYGFRISFTNYKLSDYCYPVAKILIHIAYIAFLPINCHEDS